MESYPQPYGQPPYRPSWRRVPLIPVALLLLALAILTRNWYGGGALHDPQAEPRPVMARGDLAADEKATIEIFESASPSVAYITTSTVQGNYLTFDATEMP